MVTSRNVMSFVTLVTFIAAVAAGVTLLVISGGSGGPAVEILLPTTTPTPELMVYVSGEVASPGVYTLKRGDRVTDALITAGGASQGALLSCINLALRVKDEDQVHVPGPEEPCQSPTIAGSTEQDGKLDLNTASVEEFEALPGIGSVKAQAIVDYRGTSGPFLSTQQLIEVPGVGSVTYQGIEDLVYVEDGQP